MNLTENFLTNAIIDSLVEIHFWLCLKEVMVSVDLADHQHEVLKKVRTWHAGQPPEHRPTCKASTFYND